MSETVRTCNNLFERIYSGEQPDRVTFRSKAGVYNVLAYRQATAGHTLVVPATCQPKVELLFAEDRRKVATVEAMTKIWLQAALNPEYVGSLQTGKEMPHAHGHVVPTYGERDWLRVMGAPDPRPFPVMSDEQLDAIQAAATLPEEYAEALEAELQADGSILPSQFVEMAHDLNRSSGGN